MIIPKLTGVKTWEARSVEEQQKLTRFWQSSPRCHPTGLTFSGVEFPGFIFHQVFQGVDFTGARRQGCNKWIYFRKEVITNAMTHPLQIIIICFISWLLLVNYFQGRSLCSSNLPLLNILASTNRFIVEQSGSFFC